MSGNARTRVRRPTVTLDPDTHRELKRRARLHKTTMAGFVRALVTGHRPGGAPGQAAAAADTWWEALPPARRAQIHSWVGPSSQPDVDPGQMDLVDLLSRAYADATPSPEESHT